MVDAKDKSPLFPFGYGLSYTRFGYTGLSASTNGEAPKVEFQLSNVGSCAGSEVAQVYVSLPTTAGAPPQRLAGWARESLLPGQQRKVIIKLEPKAFAVWDTTRSSWIIPAGDYLVTVGSSSRDARLKTHVQIAADQAVKNRNQ